MRYPPTPTGPAHSGHQEAFAPRNAMTEVRDMADIRTPSDFSYSDIHQFRRVDVLVGRR